MVHPHRPPWVEATGDLRVQAYTSEERAGHVTEHAEGDDVLLEAAPICHLPAAGGPRGRRRCCRRRAVAPLTGTAQGREGQGRRQDGGEAEGRDSGGAELVQRRGAHREGRRRDGGGAEQVRRGGAHREAEGQQQYEDGQRHQDHQLTAASDVRTERHLQQNSVKRTQCTLHIHI